MLHHDSEKPDDHLGARSQENLALPALLGVVDALEGIGQTLHSHHFDLKKSGKLGYRNRSRGRFLASLTAAASFERFSGSRECKCDRKRKELFPAANADWWVQYPGGKCRLSYVR